jgi:hypothetical protein
MPVPDSLPWMESVDVKIARAHEHLSALEVAVAEYNKNTKRKLILKLNREETIVSLMTWVKDPYPPLRTSALIGDCAYNTRAALDNLVCGLLRASKPASKCAGSKFPILTDRDKWEKAKSSIRGISGSAAKLIESLQPFNRSSGSEVLDPLSILNTVRNGDTHRAALLTSGFSRNTRFAIHTNDGEVLYIRIDRPLFGEGFDAIPLDIAPSRVAPSARVEAMGTSVMVFRDEGPWRDRSVVDVMDSCLRYVEDTVIRQFRPFFPRV